MAGDGARPRQPSPPAPLPNSGERGDAGSGDFARDGLRTRAGLDAQSAKADLVPFQRRVSNPSWMSGTRGDGGPAPLTGMHRNGVREGGLCAVVAASLLASSRLFRHAAPLFRHAAPPPATRADAWVSIL